MENNMKIIKIKELFPLKTVIGVFIGITSLYASSSIVLKTDASKRIRVVISNDSMNRIAFANDRIAQVFGDEEAYTLQSDEARGQIFIKPTLANGDKPIAVTLTTENNEVQDIEFAPQKMSSATIILTVDKKKETQATEPFLGTKQRHFYEPSSSYASHLQSGNDLPAQLVRALKKTASKPIHEKEEGVPLPSELKVPGLVIEGLRVDVEGNLSISTYYLKNDADTSIELTEKMFETSQILAISLEKRLLQPKEGTHLFVIRAS